MRPRKCTLNFIILSSITAMLVLLAACSNPPGTDPRKDSPSSAREESLERVEVQVDAGDDRPVTVELLPNQETPLPDGLSILEKHCVRCHLVRELEQTGKSRTELEQKLVQMEAFGVHLGDTEKEALLDYLAQHGDS